MASTHVQGLVTKAFVVLAKSVYQPSATVDRWRKSCFAQIAVTRRKATECTPLKVTDLSWKAGQECSSVAISVSANSTVESTSARRSATRKRRRHRIVRDRQTSSHTAHVERRRSRRFRMQQERRVRTTFRAAHSHAGRLCHAVIHASRSVIPEAAAIASRLSTFSAGVVAHLPNRFATKVRPKHLSACAFAGPR